MNRFENVDILAALEQLILFLNKTLQIISVI